MNELINQFINLLTGLTKKLIFVKVMKNPDRGPLGRRLFIVIGVTLLK